MLGTGIRAITRMNNKEMELVKLDSNSSNAFMVELNNKGYGENLYEFQQIKVDELEEFMNKTNIDSQNKIKLLCDFIKTELNEVDSIKAIDNAETKEDGQQIILQLIDKRINWAFKEVDISDEEKEKIIETCVYEIPLLIDEIISNIKPENN